MATLAIAFSAAICGSASLRAADKDDPSAPTPAAEAKEEKKAITFPTTYYGEFFANLSGGVERGGAAEGLLKVGVDVDLDQVLHLPKMRFVANALYAHGRGLTNRYVHDYNVLSNIDAYDSVRLFEMWIERTFANDRVTLRLGQLTTDNNFFVSDNAGLYVNSAFGTIGTALHNIVTPIYPVGSLGAFVKVQLAPSFYFQAMVVDDDPGAQDVKNKHGLRFHLGGNSGALAFYETGYQRTGTSEAPVLEGKYKLGGYYDSASFADESGGPEHRGNYGFYAVVDQQLYREYLQAKDTFRGLSAFSRVSVAPRDRNPVSFYFDAGLNYTGLLPGRDKDILGVALSYEQLSGDLRGSDGARVPSHHEHIIEASYIAIFYNDRLAVQPDFQFIINPGGTGATPNAAVAGLRVILTF